MSLTQRRFIQIPLFLALIFMVVLPLEWTVFSQLPFRLGPFNVFAILFTYIAITRSMTRTLIIALCLGFLSSLAFPFALGAAIAAVVWSTLATKLLTFLLPFDSRGLFAFLVCINSLTTKVLWRFLTYSQFRGVPLGQFVLGLFPPAITLFALAYLILPFLFFWDDFFENSSSMGANDLSPRIMGMTR